jgi:hypothetical protein
MIFVFTPVDDNHKTKLARNYRWDAVWVVIETSKHFSQLFQFLDDFHRDQSPILKWIDSFDTMRCSLSFELSFEQKWTIDSSRLIDLISQNWKILMSDRTIPIDCELIIITDERSSQIMSVEKKT